MSESNDSEWGCGHLVDLINEESFVAFIEGLQFTFCSSNVLGQWENSIWGSLDVDVDKIITLVNGASSVEKSWGGLSQWNLSNNSLDIKSSVDLGVDWYISVLEELKESNFGSVTYWDKFGLSHLDVCTVVVQDTLLDKSDGLFLKLAVKDGIWSSILLSDTF